MSAIAATWSELMLLIFLADKNFMMTNKENGKANLVVCVRDYKTFCINTLYVGDKCYKVSVNEGWNKCWGEDWEANRTRSKANFYNKIKISESEASETVY